MFFAVPNSHLKMPPRRLIIPLVGLTLEFSSSKSLFSTRIDSVSLCSVPFNVALLSMVAC